MQPLNNNSSNPYVTLAQQQQLLGGMQLQQNGLGALGGLGGMPVGGMGGNINLGGRNIGGNIGGNFAQNQNTANLIQQSLKQQESGSQNQVGVGDDGGLAGTKRSLDDAALRTD